MYSEPFPAGPESLSPCACSASSLINFPALAQAELSTWNDPKHLHGQQLFTLRPFSWPEVGVGWVEETAFCTMYLIVSLSINWPVSSAGCRERCVRLCLLSFFGLLDMMFFRGEAMRLLKGHLHFSALKLTRDPASWDSKR